MEVQGLVTDNATTNWEQLLVDICLDKIILFVHYRWILNRLGTIETTLLNYVPIRV